MKKLILLFSLSLIVFSCAKKDNNNTVTPVQQYVFVNGVCVDQANPNLPVNQQLCQNTSSQYSCIITATGQQVPLSNCQSQGQQCFGQYIYIQNGTTQAVTCAGANCRGYTLISQTTNQQVVCQ